MKIAIISVLIVFMSCANTKSIVSKAQINNLKKVVAAKNFEVVCNWAQPLPIAGITGLNSLMPPGSTFNNINLIGNTNFFKVKKDSIHMDLPYFGQQRISVGYGSSSSGINFKGKLNKYTASFNEKKNAYILKYWLNGKEENYTIILTLFANNTSILSLNSSHRTAINYNGNWKETTIKK
jgi:hypothetical protein